MLTESVVLAVIGGAAGVAIAWAAVPLLAYLITNTLPMDAKTTLDLRVLAIAGAFTALTGVGFGLIPALRVGGRAGFDALREGSRSGGGRRQRLRTVLVSLDVAISVVLLISSGLLIRPVMRVQAKLVWRELHQARFDLERIGTGCDARAVRDAKHVRVDRNRRFAERDVQHDVGGLAPDTRLLFERFAIARHLSTVFILQDL
jgi:hypothetical protein